MNELKEALIRITEDLSDITRSLDGNISKIGLMEERIKMALTASEEWRVPDETTPEEAPIWRRYIGYSRIGVWILDRWKTLKDSIDDEQVVLAKENQGPPPEDYRP